MKPSREEKIFPGLYTKHSFSQMAQHPMDLLLTREDWGKRGKKGEVSRGGGGEHKKRTPLLLPSKNKGKWSNSLKGGVSFGGGKGERRTAIQIRRGENFQVLKGEEKRRVETATEKCFRDERKKRGKERRGP